MCIYIYRYIYIYMYIFVYIHRYIHIITYTAKSMPQKQLRHYKTHDRSIKARPNKINKEHMNVSLDREQAHFRNNLTMHIARTNRPRGGARWPLATYTYIQREICIHTYTYVYIYSLHFELTLIYVVRVLLHVDVSTYIYIDIKIYKNIGGAKYICICIYMCIYTRNYIYMLIHVCIHLFACLPFCGFVRPPPHM